MWKRVELHNHSIESDGSLSVRELTRYLAQKGIYSFSLTDHNTVSGFPMLHDACRLPSGESLECIKGYELTSYYGHLLCQNVPSYIPWDDIDMACADPLFMRVHEAGGLAGPAHPFSVPFPFSNGMRWSMKIRDYHLVDFIEVINNAHPMYPDNREAILWWENLVFSGFSICPVTGMDLHRPVCMDGFYTTYIKVENGMENLPLALQLDHAIRTCSACVTRGPVLDWTLKKYEDILNLRVFLAENSAPLFSVNGPPLCQVRTKDRVFTLPFENGSCSLNVSEFLSYGSGATVMLFENAADMSGPTAIARPLFIPR